MYPLSACYSMRPGVCTMRTDRHLVMTATARHNCWNIQNAVRKNANNDSLPSTKKVENQTESTAVSTTWLAAGKNARVLVAEVE